jgi:lipoyl(octanoyl) transferase
MKFYNLGCVPYHEALSLQKELHLRVMEKKHPSSVLILEHPPVITVGKNAELKDLLSTEASLKTQGIDLVHIERGGNLTAHEPGQLVVYPIIDMRQYKLAPRQYVQQLEEVLLRLLSNYNLSAQRLAAYPGVWVERGEDLEKFAAIGIRIAQHVSYHGLSLNVLNDLSIFKHIIPCGLQGRGICSLKSLLNSSVCMDDVITLFIKCFSEVFGLTEYTLCDRSQFPWMTK